MRYLAVVAAAGCGFHGPARVDDAMAAGDAVAGADACDDITCRPAAQCRDLHAAHPELGDGAYPIGAPAVTTYCDMTNGGWTLIGKVDAPHDMATTWLVSSVDPGALATPTIAPNSYACLDAVDLAVNHSTEIRISNSARTRWVTWPLPVGRTAATWWRHTAGQTVIAAAPQTAVTVTAQDGATSACFQNIYGILPYAMHGGAYPVAAKNATGNTTGNDLCMAVGTMVMSSTVLDGFTQNGNGFDAPSDETTWPNTNYAVPPHVAIWLR